MPEIIFQDPGEPVLSLGDVSTRIFHPHKLLALKILSMNDQVEVRELKHDLRTTDGNLASNLRALEDDGFIKTSRRDMPGSKSRVLCEITPEGRTALDDIVKVLRILVEE